MKKLNKKKKGTKIHLRAIIYLSVFFILFGIITIILPTLPAKKYSYGASNIVSFTPAPAQQNLQLYWFIPQMSTAPSPNSVSTSPLPISPTGNVTSSSPNPATCSNYVDSGVPIPSNCDCPTNLIIVCPYTTTDPIDVTVGPNGCGSALAPTTGKFCIDKPVIYLYPPHPMFVKVVVKTTGSIVVSNPLYPVGGWNNILAFPNGVFEYQKQLYSELFYETSASDFQKPTIGITIPKNQLAQRLSSILSQLGLIGNEKTEFLAYWVPKLQSLPTPYIFFSLLNPAAKESIDNVTILPKPNTEIDFIAYFKPVVTMFNGPTLILPPAPQRTGFVTVEWGGVIDNQQNDKGVKSDLIN